MEGILPHSPVTSSQVSSATFFNKLVTSRIHTYSKLKWLRLLQQLTSLHGSFRPQEDVTAMLINPTFSVHQKPFAQFLHCLQEQILQGNLHGIHIPTKHNIIRYRHLCLYAVCVLVPQQVVQKMIQKMIQK